MKRESFLDRKSVVGGVGHARLSFVESTIVDIPETCHLDMTIVLYQLQNYWPEISLFKGIL